MEMKLFQGWASLALLLVAVGVPQSAHAQTDILQLPENTDSSTGGGTQIPSEPNSSDSVQDTERKEEGGEVENKVTDEDEDSDGDADDANKEDGDMKDDRMGKLFAQYTTRTNALFVTSTKTALSTCFSATSTACGRRRKRSPGRQNPFAEWAESMVLSPSESSGSEEENGAAGPGQQQPQDADREGKKLTIWSTLFSTYTITTYTYYPGTTVYISGYCSISGVGSSCFG